jgi:hypothetical protein
MRQSGLLYVLIWLKFHAPLFSPRQSLAPQRESAKKFTRRRGGIME